MKPKTKFSYTYDKEEVFDGEGEKRKKVGDIFHQKDDGKPTGRIYCPKDQDKKNPNKQALMLFATNQGFPKTKGVKNIHLQNPPIQCKSSDKVIILNRYFDLKTAKRRTVVQPAELAEAVLA